jgi:hypothetical protein
MENELWDMLEAAWGIIANAGGGDWKKETGVWQEAAARWREHWHKLLESRAPKSGLIVEYTRPCSWCGRYGCEHPNPFMRLTVGANTQVRR